MAAFEFLEPALDSKVDFSDFQADYDGDDRQAIAGAPAIAAWRKRARDADDESAGPESKRPKKSSMDARLAELRALATATPADQIRFVHQFAVANVKAKLSALELEQYPLWPEASLAPCAIEPEQASGLRPLASLPEALKIHFGGKWKKALSNPGPDRGRPAVLVLCASAIRCVDVVRALRVFADKGLVIGKLFAKHLKMTDQIHFLAHHCVRIVVGNPNRIAKLIDERALDLSELRLVLLDMHRDAKSLTLLDLHDVRTELADLLLHALYPLLADRARIMLY